VTSIRALRTFRVIKVRTAGMIVARCCRDRKQGRLPDLAHVALAGAEGGEEAQAQDALAAAFLRPVALAGLKQIEALSRKMRGMLEALGRLFSGPVKLFAYPTIVPESGIFIEALEAELAARGLPMPRRTGIRHWFPGYDPQEERARLEALLR